MNGGAVTRPSSLTQNGAILAVLADGGWHTTSDVHARAGYSRLNSRISELRRRGYVIDCEHVPGVQHGPSAYRYRLLATPDEATASDDLSPVDAAVASSDAAQPVAPSGGPACEVSASEPLQLALV